jgi:hypothetical protein
LRSIKGGRRPSAFDGRTHSPLQPRIDRWLAAGFDISGVFFKQNDTAQGFWNKSSARAERRPACRRTDGSE